jgi:hypothetical protein
MGDVIPVGKYKREATDEYLARLLHQSDMIEKFPALQAAWVARYKKET